MPKCEQDNAQQESKRRNCTNPTQVSVYDDFALRGDQIRILSLHPRTPLDGSIICSLEVASLRKSPAFEALSYTWNSPVKGLTLPDRWITFCGEAKQVKGNLFDALKRFRCPQKPRKLWVDALCINQDNHVERSQQVEMMSRIYRAAKVVQVWLGEDRGDAKISMGYFQKVYRYVQYFQSPPCSKPILSAVECREALFAETDWLKAVAQLKADDPHNLDPAYEDLDEVRWLNSVDGGRVSETLKRFIARSYFKRRWILQELYHARRAEAWCGSENIPWEQMEIAFNFLTNHDGRIFGFTVGDGECEALRCRTTLRAESRRGVSSLMTLLDRFNSSLCGDVRDQIYALLGLVRQTSLRPDYRLTPVEIWIQVARAGVHEGLAMSLLRSAALQMCFSGRPDGLPSWIPNFGCGYFNWKPPCQTLDADHAFVDDQNRLTCSLNCYGEVVFCNGWALLKELTTEEWTSDIMGIQPGPGDGSSYPKAPEPVLGKDPMPKQSIPLKFVAREDIGAQPGCESSKPKFWTTSRSWSCPRIPVPRGITMKAGDLICADRDEDLSLIVRAVTNERVTVDSLEQEWIIVGDNLDYPVPKTKITGVLRKFKFV